MQRYMNIFPFLKNHYACLSLGTLRGSGVIWHFFPLSQWLWTLPRTSLLRGLFKEDYRVQADLLISLIVGEHKVLRLSPDLAVCLIITSPWLLRKEEISLRHYQLLCCEFIISAPFKHSVKPWIQRRLVKSYRKSSIRCKLSIKLY